MDIETYKVSEKAKKEIKQFMQGILYVSVYVGLWTWVLYMLRMDSLIFLFVLLVGALIFVPYLVIYLDYMEYQDKKVVRDKTK